MKKHRKDRKEWIERATRKSNRREGNWSGKHEIMRSNIHKQLTGLHHPENTERDEQPCQKQHQGLLGSYKKGRQPRIACKQKQVNRQRRSSNRCHIGRGSYQPIIAQCQCRQLWVQPIKDDSHRMTSTDVILNQLFDETTGQANQKMTHTNEVAERTNGKRSQKRDEILPSLPLWLPLTDLMPCGCPRVMK